MSAVYCNIGNTEELSVGKGFKCRERQEKPAELVSQFTRWHLLCNG